MKKENRKTTEKSEAGFIQLELEELDEWNVDDDIKTVEKIKSKIEKKERRI